MEKFKNDFTVMKMFFDQLVKKVETYIGEQKEPLPDRFVRIKKICNQSLCQKDLFKQIFAENIDQLLSICRKSLIKHSKSRDLLQLTYLVTEASRLKKDELETSEFSMMYEQEEKMTDQELMAKIEGKEVEQI